MHVSLRPHGVVEPDGPADYAPLVTVSPLPGLPGRIVDPRSYAVARAKATHDALLAGLRARTAQGSGAPADTCADGARETASAKDTAAENARETASAEGTMSADGAAHAAGTSTEMARDAALTKSQL